MFPYLYWRIISPAVTSTTPKSVHLFIFWRINNNNGPTIIFKYSCKNATHNIYCDHFWLMYFCPLRELGSRLHKSTWLCLLLLKLMCAWSCSVICSSFVLPCAARWWIDIFLMLAFSNDWCGVYQLISCWINDNFLYQAQYRQWQRDELAALALWHIQVEWIWWRLLIATPRMIWTRIGPVLQWKLVWTKIWLTQQPRARNWLE